MSVNRRSSWRTSCFLAKSRTSWGLMCVPDPLASAGGDQLLTQTVFQLRRQFAAIVGDVEDVHRPAALRVDQHHVYIARRGREYRREAVEQASPVFRNDLH